MYFKIDCYAGSKTDGQGVKEDYKCSRLHESLSYVLPVKYKKSRIPGITKNWKTLITNGPKIRGAYNNYF